MDKPAFVHPTAFVDPGAQLGENTKVWHFCHVYPKAVIGRNTILGQNVMVADGVSIGDFCKIQNNVSLYEGVILEDYVFCGPSMVFTNVTTPRCLFPRFTSEDYRTTRVKRGASIGANATIVCGVTLHECAFVAAGAVVTRDVPPYVLAVGQPAEPHSVNGVGLKRRGFTDEQIRNVRRAYRVLYRSGLKLQAALDMLDKAAETQAEIRPFVEFIRRSSRSIVR